MCDILSKTFMSPLIKKKAFSVLEPREKKREFLSIMASYFLRNLFSWKSWLASSLLCTISKKSVLVTGLLRCCFDGLNRLGKQSRFYVHIKSVCFFRLMGVVKNLSLSVTIWKHFALILIKTR